MSESNDCDDQLEKYNTKKKIVVVGSGWASASFIKNINTTIYDIEVIAPNVSFIYTPLLSYSAISGFDVKEKITDLNSIQYIKNNVVDVDFNNNYVVVENKSGDDEREKISYDYLVLAHGAQVNTFNIQGVDKFCYYLKNDSDAWCICDRLSLESKKRLDLRDKLKLDHNTIENIPKKNIAVIGCGLAGAELVGNLIDLDKFNIMAIDGLPNPLANFKNKNLSNWVKDLWELNDVQCYFGNFVKKIDDKNIYFAHTDKTLSNDTSRDLKSDINISIPYDIAIWCGGIKISPLSLTVNKFLGVQNRFGIPVGENFNVTGYDNVFAIGDCAYSGLMPSAQVAFQQGKFLANHFNSGFWNNHSFKFRNLGQICYVGKGNSVYKLNDMVFKGKFTGYFNSVIHAYNAINFKQSWNNLWK